MRFHVLNLPHTETNKKYVLCAYTQKVVKFCSMMMSLGHEVYLYGSENNEAPCTEFISCISNKEQKKLFGDYDWKKEFFRIDWSPEAAHWKVFNSRAVAEIATRKEKDDFICLIMGRSQKQVADAFPDLMPVEFGIGYEGTFSDYRVFESYAWMHTIYGQQQGAMSANGRNYDVVIPNYFDPEDFPTDKPQDYYLYIGRVIDRKGYKIAIETCKAINKPLIIAGQLETPDSKIEWGDFKLGKYMGTVGVKERGILMSKAIATFVPTIYVEPFGGVAVESMLCGTPVITSDWGAFAETNEHGETGFRCHTLKDFVKAAKQAKDLNRNYIRERAVTLYSMWNIRYDYEEYFNRLLDLRNGKKGWYEL